MSDHLFEDGIRLLRRVLTVAQRIHVDAVSYRREERYDPEGFMAMHDEASEIGQLLIEIIRRGDPALIDGLHQLGASHEDVH